MILALDRLEILYLRCHAIWEVPGMAVGLYLALGRDKDTYGFLKSWVASEIDPVFLSLEGRGCAGAAPVPLTLIKIRLLLDMQAI